MNAEMGETPAYKTTAVWAKQACSLHNLSLENMKD